MILVEDPYFNEPGWERSRGTPKGADASRGYNSNIQRYTAQHAILGALQKPNSAFAGVIRSVRGPLCGSAALGTMTDGQRHP